MMVMLMKMPVLMTNLAMMGVKQPGLAVAGERAKGRAGVVGGEGCQEGCG